MKTFLLICLWIALASLVLSPFVFMMLNATDRRVHKLRNMREVRVRKVGMMRELAMPYMPHEPDPFAGLLCPGECCDDPSKCRLRPWCHLRAQRGQPPITDDMFHEGGAPMVRPRIDAEAIYANWNKAPAASKLDVRDHFPPGHSDAMKAFMDTFSGCREPKP